MKKILGLAFLFCACSGPAPVKDVVRIGAAVSETGDFAREGKDTRRGYDLWLERINQRGGLEVGGKKLPVELVYYDDESSADTASRLAERLITQDGARFLLGPYSSGLTKSMAAIAEKRGVLMVEGNGSADSLFSLGFQNLFAVQAPASLYVEPALEALAARGAKSVVIAYEDTAFPTDVGRGAEATARRLGMDVLAVETYPKGVTDLSGLLAKFKALAPDVFVGGGHYNDALLFVQGARELGFQPGAMVLTVGPSNPQFVEELGQAAEGVMGATQWERTMPGYHDAFFGGAEDYAVLYEKKFGEPPTYQSAQSTAAALALQMAIEKAGSLDTDKVRDALRNLDAMTFFGPIRFDATGKNTAKRLGAVQIQQGKIQLVAPAEIAVSKLAYPR